MGSLTNSNLGGRTNFSRVMMLVSLFSIIMAGKQQIFNLTQSEAFSGSRFVQILI